MGPPKCKAPANPQHASPAAVYHDTSPPWVNIPIPASLNNPGAPVMCELVYPSAIEPGTADIWCQAYLKLIAQWKDMKDSFTCNALSHMDVHYECSSLLKQLSLTTAELEDAQAELTCVTQTLHNTNQIVESQCKLLFAQQTDQEELYTLHQHMWELESLHGSKNMGSIESAKEPSSVHKECINKLKCCNKHLFNQHTKLQQQLEDTEEAYRVHGETLQDHVQQIQTLLHGNAILASTVSMLEQTASIMHMSSLATDLEHHLGHLLGHWESAGSHELDTGPPSPGHICISASVFLTTLALISIILSTKDPNIVHLHKYLSNLINHTSNLYLQLLFVAGRIEHSNHAVQESAEHIFNQYASAQQYSLPTLSESIPLGHIQVNAPSVIQSTTPYPTDIAYFCHTDPNTPFPNPLPIASALGMTSFLCHLDNLIASLCQSAPSTILPASKPIFDVDHEGEDLYAMEDELGDEDGGDNSQAEGAIDKLGDEDKDRVEAFEGSQPGYNDISSEDEVGLHAQ
ncbi:hypothetical protein GYMLUDRAFT_59722 [Collybiopsis luxurians FD-317 M1]|uniref:Unplaced genomic scaffold GYMLUscaffold_29, whole genome shotgun sequence n=1 Tax=Collybiopsis luxurians FD-317 M1 TaxID=944289 RepID=A0A0D0CMS0_9AGAR|nr:hypothetical protein GYMLUDRAFT_59722 [Collybiopsis luxurians FD-317 M1]